MGPKKFLAVVVSDVVDEFNIRAALELLAEPLERDLLPVAARDGRTPMGCDIFFRPDAKVGSAVLLLEPRRQIVRGQIFKLPSTIEIVRTPSPSCRSVTVRSIASPSCPGSDSSPLSPSSCSCGTSMENRFSR